MHTACHRLGWEQPKVWLTDRVRRLGRRVDGAKLIRVTVPAPPDNFGVPIMPRIWRRWCAGFMDVGAEVAEGGVRAGGVVERLDVLDHRVGEVGSGGAAALSTGAVVPFGASAFVRRPCRPSSHLGSRVREVTCPKSWLFRLGQPRCVPPLILVL